MSWLTQVLSSLALMVKGSGSRNCSPPVPPPPALPLPDVLPPNLPVSPPLPWPPSPAKPPPVCVVVELPPPRGYPLLSRVKPAPAGEDVAEPVERAHGHPHHGRGVAVHDAADLVAKRVLPSQNLSSVVAGKARYGVYVCMARHPLGRGTRRPPAPGPRYRVEAPPHACPTALRRDLTQLLVALQIRQPVVHEVRDGVLLGDAPPPARGSGPACRARTPPCPRASRAGASSRCPRRRAHQETARPRTGRHGRACPMPASSPASRRGAR